MSIMRELSVATNWGNTQLAHDFAGPRPDARCDKENLFAAPFCSSDSKRRPDETHPDKYKTELCKNWEEKGFCSYGNKCRFAHGVDELNYKNRRNNKYKSRPCQAFFSTMFCPYGNRCLFQHDERKVEEINTLYYTLLLQNPQLRDSVAKRRLAVFQSLPDGDEPLLARIYQRETAAVEKMLANDDAAAVTLHEM